MQTSAFDILETKWLAQMMIYEGQGRQINSPPYAGNCRSSWIANHLSGCHKLIFTHSKSVRVKNQHIYVIFIYGGNHKKLRQIHDVTFFLLLSLLLFLSSISLHDSYLLLSNLSSVFLFLSPTPLIPILYFVFLLF